ncbi:hypothetical protein BDQ17DRAFT_947580 [Cyathus striatus]|nr:hypothetical protein BDQ17DRAFT_947580 [Cyathus striatus]
MHYPPPPPPTQQEHTTRRRYSSVSSTSSQAYPSIISFPVSSSPRAAEYAQDADGAGLSDEDSPSEGSGKKHVCPTCFKRFNRPSSLRIHVNTHTGATPFRCPWAKLRPRIQCKLQYATTL